MEKTDLLILVKNPFSQRDYDRMGILPLSRWFKVQVLDCTPWLLPEAMNRRTSDEAKTLPVTVCRIGGYREFIDVLKQTPAGIAVDYVGGFSVNAYAMYYGLWASGIRVATLDSGNIPYPGHVGGRWSRIRASLMWYAGGRYRRLPQAIFRAVILRLLARIRRCVRLDYAFVSGRAGMQTVAAQRPRQIIPVHTFDFELSLAIRSLPRVREGKYAVFIDENLTEHEDDAEHGLEHSVSTEKYTPALTRFFAEFCRVAEMPVVVAGYPSSVKIPTEKYGQVCLMGETARLIRDAELVFSHGSTATGFAIIWRRPIVHLVSGELLKSWYMPWIEAMCAFNHGSLVNIDDEVFPDAVARWFEIDTEAYQNYEETFIRAAGDRDVSLWTTMAEAMTRISSEEQK